MVNESTRKPNKLWVDQRKEFYSNNYARMIRK